MNRFQNIKNRIAVLESKLLVLEGAEDREKLRAYLGDDLYTAYMAIRNRIPSEADLLKQYPEYSFAVIDDDDAKFKEFAKRYIKLRKSNLITGIGENKWRDIPDVANKNDLYRSFMDYMDMRDFVIENFDKFRSFEKLRQTNKSYIRRFVDSYRSISEIIAEAKEGADLLYSDGNWEVYKVRTYAASKYYGKGTKWCISGNYDGHESRGEFYFNDYISKKNLDGGYYFYLSKSDPDRKYCLLQNKDGNPLSMWNARDDELDVNYEIDDLELPYVKEIHLPDYRIDNLVNAIGNEDIETVRDFLANHDPDINLDGLDSNGDNAVTAAAGTGNIQILKMLLDAGLNPNVKSRNSYSALLLSVLDDEYEIEELLLKRGADPNILCERRAGSRTPLYIAVQNASETNSMTNKKIPSIKLLLKYGADPDITEDERNRTPLFIAARYGKLELVKILFDGGADPNAQTSGGTTPLDQAIKNKHEDVAEYLRSVGAKQNTTLEDYVDY